MATTVFKKAGETVFRRHDDPGAGCVLETLMNRDPWRSDLPWPEGFEGGIAHRLDVWTSGAIWVADDPAELMAMREAFRGGLLEKRYLFVAARDVPWNHNEVRRSVAHDKRRKKRMVVQRSENTPHRGKWYPAHTRFQRVEDRLWRAVITTGVMHQIRVHAAFVGIPLLGDALYGGGPSDTGFRLHHVGLRHTRTSEATDAVALPAWARAYTDVQ